MLTRFCSNQTLVAIDGVASEMYTDPVLTPDDVEKGQAVLTFHAWRLEGGTNDMTFNVYQEQSNDGAFWFPDPAAIFSETAAVLTGLSSNPTGFVIPSAAAYVRLRIELDPSASGTAFVNFDLVSNWISNG